MTVPPPAEYQGRHLANLGCGTTTAEGWTNIDFSWYAWLANHPAVARILHDLSVLSETRYERLRSMEGVVVHWDLREGIPYADETFDAIYNSHLLEHIPRTEAVPFLRECRRVLKSEGVIRVVVPDLKILVEQYLNTIRGLDEGHVTAASHEAAIEAMFEQMVRTKPAGTKEQSGWVQTLETWFRGDADDVGETHKWMYDRWSLARCLQEAGFESTQATGPSKSDIPHWDDFQLDMTDEGEPRKPESLYIEARKP